MDLPARRPNRLPDFDYSGPGAYFITICTAGKQPLFWSVGATCGRPPLSPAGAAVEREIRLLDTVYPAVRVDHFVVMPNHVHLLLSIESAEDGRPQAAPTVSRVVQQFKGAVTKKLGASVWQKSFHDHVIRDQADYLVRWRYIDENPARWAEDEYHV